MNTYKIVLTGGPCGGKTETIGILSKKLIEYGYSVMIIDETANSLLKLGYIPNINISVFDFQNLLFRIQLLKEYISEGKSKILLCDRGLLDGKVYIDNNSFQKILSINNIDEQTILHTYDGALYFKSISYEYPEEFILKRSYETPEVGMFRDRLCKEIWSKKIIPCDYDNLDGFENKQKIIYISLRKHIELLDNVSSYNLTDYYDKDYFEKIYIGINSILESNNVSRDIKIKTRELIK